MTFFEKYKEILDGPSHMFEEFDGGWKHIIESVMDELLEVNSRGGCIRVIRIKEKWGALRCICSRHKDFDDEVNAITNEAELESSRTCMVCGEAGWIRRNLPCHIALCNDHYNEMINFDPEQNLN